MIGHIKRSWIQIRAFEYCFIFSKLLGKTFMYICLPYKSFDEFFVGFILGLPTSSQNASQVLQAYNVSFQIHDLNKIYFLGFTGT